MVDTNYHMEARRKAMLYKKRAEILRRLTDGRQSCCAPFIYPFRAGPFPDYPHDHRKNVFGVGGYDDPVATSLSEDEMKSMLRDEAETGNRLVPEVYHALRRRDRQLRNGLMYMGPLTAFTDYFPPWSRSFAGGNRCDERSCVASQSPPPDTQNCNIGQRPTRKY